MKFIASIFIILAFTPQSEAGELWDFSKGAVCSIFTDYILCAKANKKEYYSGKCEKIFTLSPAEKEKFSLLVEDENNEEDIKKILDFNEYAEEILCPANPYPIGFFINDPKQDAKLKTSHREWLDCMMQKFYPMFLERLQCKELLKNSEPETNEPETNEPETNEPETNEPETNEPETKKNYKK